MKTDADSISERQLHELLARGGFEVIDTATARDARPTALPRYNALRDPAGAEELGRALSRVVATSDIGTVLIWQEATDVALGFVVARELSVPAVRCVDNDGLVAYEGAFGDGPGVVIVTDVLRDAESVRAMVALAEQQDKSVVGAAVLLDAPTSGAGELRTRGVAVRSLVAAGEPA